jgi:hypothetical protein
MRRVLRAHFVWHYFEARSTLGLGLDWARQSQATKQALANSPLLRDMAGRCDDLIKRLKALLLFYFGVFLKLVNRGQVPVVLGSTSLLKFPATMTTRYVYDENATLDTNAAAFDSLNQLFTADAGPVQFIRNAQFRRYYLDGVAEFLPNYRPKSKEQTVREAQNEPPPPISQDASSTGGSEPFVRAHYPITALHGLLARYDRFLALYRTFLGQQLDEVEAGLQAVDRITVQIAREEPTGSGGAQHPPYEQRLSFTGQPINSGIIRLKAVVVLFMNKAFNMIRLYCPALADCTQQDLQSRAAFDAGLGADYACYVAALIAENQITFPVSYKSKAAQQYTQANSVNTMNRLKLYRKRVARGGDLEFFIERDQLPQPVIRARRTSSIYVTM